MSKQNVIAFNYTVSHNTFIGCEATLRYLFTLLPCSLPLTAKEMFKGRVVLQEDLALLVYVGNVTVVVISDCLIIYLYLS